MSRVNLLEDKKKELEQKYMLYQFLKEQLGRMGEQAEAMRNAMLETQSSVKALEELTSHKKENTALIPLGAGAFVRGRVGGIDKVLVAIGNDIVVEENSADAKQRLEGRLKEMEHSYDKLLKDLGSVTAQVQSVLPEVERLAGELNYSDSKKQGKK